MVKDGLIVKLANPVGGEKVKREGAILHADPLRLCAQHQKERRRALNELNGYLKNNIIIIS
jgi:hypothetical protein